MSSSPTLSEPLMLVACLCAQWCGTCNDYRPLFAQLEAEFPGSRFVWVDIEDEADLVDPVEVENFPTLLIATAGSPRFFGTVMPHLETLRRMVQTSADPSSRHVTDPEVIALTQRLLSR